MDTNRNDKRIAKNTLYLYIRMFFTMLLGVFTSRVVLQALGETDFGIHNVVSGIVLMLTFLNNTLIASTQRYLNMAIGERSVEYVKEVFSASVRIHLLLSFIILTFAETLGIWFLNSKMNIPDDRMLAANVVFQFSVLAFMFVVNQSPLQAMVISQERMNVFAAISVVDVATKFGIALCVLYSSTDRLILYAILLSLVSVLDFSIYRYYCSTQFAECREKFRTKRKKIYHELLNFSGWASIGSLAWSLLDQGINILLNIFFGPVVNAARGLAMTVNNFAFSLVSNFTTAVSPQLIKTYASKEFDSMYDLLCKTIKFSLFLYALVALPVLYETEFVLALWLKDVPPYTVIFCQIVLLESFVMCVEHPLAITCNGIGIVKQVNMTVGLLYLVAFFMSWGILTVYNFPVIPFIVHLAVICLAVCIFLLFIQHFININLRIFLQKVVLRVILTFTIPVFCLTVVHFHIGPGWMRLLITIVVSTVTMLIMVYAVGIGSGEREQLYGFIRSKINGYKSKK